jgi:hypothetical protein
VLEREGQSATKRIDGPANCRQNAGAPRPVLLWLRRSNVELMGAATVSAFEVSEHVDEIWQRNFCFAHVLDGTAIVN